MREKKSIPINALTMAACSFVMVLALLFSGTRASGNPEGVEKTPAQVQKEWEALERQTRQEWTQLEKAVAQKWDSLMVSTQKQWVDYDASKDTRSRVDFEKGEIRIETLSLEGHGPSGEKDRKSLYQQLERILKEKAGRDEAVLKDQVLTDKNHPLTPENLDRYFKEKIADTIQTSPAPIRSKDGKKRRKYTMSLKMAPDHLRIRAGRYVHEVADLAGRFSLEPALVMAIIHTESYFNPLAVSGKGAVGLMQIVPKWAGKEAAEFLYGPGTPVPPDYLYAPGINMELGTAYLHLLHTRYYASLNDPVKIKQMAICAYNWGPTALNRNVLKRYDIAGMGRDGVKQVLLARTPEETRNYLVKVLEREEQYREYFTKAQ